MEIRAYLSIILRFWWLVLLVIIAAGAGAAALDYTKTPLYTAQSRVVAVPSQAITDTRTIVDLVGQMGARYVTGTFAQTFTSQAVTTQARRKVGLSDAGAADYPLEANVLPDTLVVEVSGTGPDPTVLANYINATVSATISNTQNLFQVMNLQVLQAASPPTEPSSPRPTRDILAGIGLGFVLGILLALALDYLWGSRPKQATARAEPEPAQAALARSKGKGWL